MTFSKNNPTNKDPYIDKKKLLINLNGLYWKIKKADLCGLDEDWLRMFNVASEIRMGPLGLLRLVKRKQLAVIERIIQEIEEMKTHAKK